jgi:hypothetical protein
MDPTMQVLEPRFEAFQTRERTSGGMTGLPPPYGGYNSAWKGVITAGTMLQEKRTTGR